MHEQIVAKEHWHLDKRVPIALITTFILQTLTIVVFATSWKVETDGRLVVLEKAVDKNTSQEARIIVVEQVAVRISEDLSEIKAILRGQRLGGEPIKEQ